MDGNEKPWGSDLAKVDAYENTAADYEEIPELDEADFARGTWHIGSRPVSEAEGRAAMKAALTAYHEPVDVPGDVLEQIPLKWDHLIG